MKRLSTFALAIVVVFVMAVGTNAQIKNVLLEQHTGAWCGWCPDGTVVMDEILDLYGDQVIGVKIHCGDAMEIFEHFIIADALGLRGFPTGSIDRKDFGGAVFLSRNKWRSSCESQIQQTAEAEVDCFFTLDKQSRTVRIQVLANIAESMDFPVKFNGFIVEDDVTGTGSGYDQTNHLSGRSGYQDHPYYFQPPKIYGYRHMKVVRRMLGGPWGTAGDLPESVSAGEFYTHEFVAQIDSGWDIDNLHFVGLLQADAPDNKEIINSAVAIENGSLLNRIVNPDMPTVKALALHSEFQNTYMLENATDRDQVYSATVMTTDRTPADWSAEFTCGDVNLMTSEIAPEAGEIVVPANSSAEFSLTLKVGSALGVGDARVLLELDGMPSVVRSRTISGITGAIEKVLIETPSEYSIEPYINRALYGDIVTLNPGDYVAFAGELTNVNLAIWNKGPFDRLSPDEIDIIKSDSGVNNLICGDAIFGGLSNSDDLGYFGLEWLGWNKEGQPPNWTVQLSGQQGDVITGALGENIEGSLIYYFINVVRITDTARVFPIIHFQHDGARQRGNNTYPITAADAICGVRTTKNESRTVLLGITPHIISAERTRRTLIDNILEWLAEDIGGREPNPNAGSLEGFESGDLSAFGWSCSGDADWLVTSGQSYAGSYSAQAGRISDNELTALCVTVNCVGGHISFCYKVSSESYWDRLRFYIDGSEEGWWSGEEGWIQVSFPVPEGTTQFKWTYSKDGISESGDDTCWIDEIEFPIASDPENHGISETATPP